MLVSMHASLPPRPNKATYTCERARSSGSMQGSISKSVSGSWVGQTPVRGRSHPLLIRASHRKGCLQQLDVYDEELRSTMLR
jgi:hypothetical protein